MLRKLFVANLYLNQIALAAGHRVEAVAQLEEISLFEADWFVQETRSYFRTLDVHHDRRFPV